MITEINKHDFHKVKHLTDSCKNIEVKAVAYGLNPGRIYVDDAENITAALIWVHGQSGFQLIGDSRSEPFLNELKEYMRERIEPELLDLHMHAVEIGVVDEAWEDVLQHISGKRDISSDIQHVFKLNPNSISQQVPLDICASQDEEVRILRIDEVLLGEKRYNNSPFLKDKISHFWTTIDDFLQHGFGYIAVHNDDIASVCLSAFIADQTHAVDIETVEVYRRRNYGAMVAKAFVEECGRVGIHPYWDCSPDNAGSIRLAQGVGMSLDFNYRVYWYDLST
ncbi:GCN5-like N-acetyltransferase [Paenibacillus sp. FSL R5-192]|uniref:GNAT family N-acetyltransferase n=1 Tax=Paenibacillus sp. FSL R5-192 TaxID=1226754 RepID=UPI0003E2ABED|nr:GNAT family N-acetyltransferase [Paenibacillus sp. FSL R5-192]ETT38107.1 GCN5-like N-acetyltransferase [Paenibacillus sp. FSL R5-192]